jgi:hypothetical protein
MKYITNNKNLLLKGELKENEAEMTMWVPEELVYTADYPELKTVLSKYLPTIYNSECFNEKNFSFSEESKNTEAGHLFEHILLEFLCIEKVKEGCEEATFEGKTSWNWSEDKPGTFHINVKVGLEDLEVFSKALKESLGLFQKIIDLRGLTPAIEKAVD